MPDNREPRVTWEQVVALARRIDENLEADRALSSHRLARLVLHLHAQTIGGAICSDTSVPRRELDWRWS